MSDLSQQNDQKAKPLKEKMPRLPSCHGGGANATDQKEVYDMVVLGRGSVAECSDDYKEDSNVREIFHMDNIEDYDILAIRDNDDFADAVQERMLNCFMTVREANKVLAERGIFTLYYFDVSYDFEEIMSETDDDFEEEIMSETEEIEYVD